MNVALGSDPSSSGIGPSWTNENRVTSLSGNASTNAIAEGRTCQLIALTVEFLQVGQQTELRRYGTCTWAKRLGESCV